MAFAVISNVSSCPKNPCHFCFTLYLLERRKSPIADRKHSSPCNCQCCLCLVPCLELSLRTYASSWDSVLALRAESWADTENRVFLSETRSLERHFHVSRYFRLCELKWTRLFSAVVKATDWQRNSGRSSALETRTTTCGVTRVRWRSEVPGGTANVISQTWTEHTSEAATRRTLTVWSGVDGRANTTR